MRRSQILTLVGIGTLAGGVAAAVAVLLPWLPTPASREAGRIDFVFWFVTVICIVIFAIVAAVLLYAVVRFRAARISNRRSSVALPDPGKRRIQWVSVSD